MKNLQDKVWAEKYRPKTIEDYVFTSDDVKTMITSWDKNEIFPNLILSGIQGTGKSSFGGILVERFDIDPNEIMRINGSTNNKLDVVRDKIEPFCQMRAVYGAYKVVIIEEAHRLTKDAQQALFDTIEKSLHVRFIFTTNYIKKLEAPLVSRCTSLNFDDHNKEAVVDRLCFIIEQEADSGNIDIDLTEETIIDRIESHYIMNAPDIRAMIHSLQQSVTNGTIEWAGKGNAASESFEAWVDCWTIDNFDFELAFTLTDGIDNNNYNEYYQVMYESLPGILEESGLDDIVADVIIDLSDYLFKAMNNLSESAIQRIHLEAFLYRLKALING